MSDMERCPLLSVLNREVPMYSINIKYHLSLRSKEVCSFDKPLTSLGVYQSTKLPMTLTKGGTCILTECTIQNMFHTLYAIVIMLCVSWLAMHKMCAYKQSLKHCVIL